MDPASFGLAVAGAAFATAKALIQLKSFYDECQTIDSDAQEFYEEVQAFQTVLDAMKNPLEALGPAAEKDIKKLWTSVDKSIRDSERTMTKLNEIFGSLNSHGKFKAYEAVMKQLKLKSKDHEITVLRTRIHSYKTNL